MKQTYKMIAIVFIVLPSIIFADDIVVNSKICNNLRVLSKQATDKVTKEFIASMSNCQNIKDNELLQECVSVASMKMKQNMAKELLIVGKEVFGQNIDIKELNVLADKCHLNN